MRFEAQSWSATLVVVEGFQGCVGGGECGRRRTGDLRSSRVARDCPEARARIGVAIWALEAARALAVADDERGLVLNFCADCRVLEARSGEQQWSEGCAVLLLLLLLL